MSYIGAPRQRTLRFMDFIDCRPVWRGQRRCEIGIKSGRAGKTSSPGLLLCSKWISGRSSSRRRRLRSGWTSLVLTGRPRDPGALTAEMEPRVIARGFRPRVITRGRQLRAPCGSRVVGARCYAFAFLSGICLFCSLLSLSPPSFFSIFLSISIV